jgi:hypothetical protein
MPWPLIAPPKLAVDQRGDVTALSSGVLAAFKPAGQAWRRATPIGTGFDDQLGLDAGGDAIAVWDTFNGRSYRMQSAFRPFGGSWRRPVTISAGAGDIVETQLVVGGRGDAIAVWGVDPIRGCCESIHTAYKPVGVSWRKPVALHSPAGDFHAGVDKAGNATIVWATARGLNASFKPAGRPWRSPATIATYPSVGGESVSLAVPARGQPIVVWTETQAINQLQCCTTTVYASVASAHGVWQAPITLGNGASAGGQPEASPAVADDSRGNALVIWVSAQGVVQAQTFTQTG